MSTPLRFESRCNESCVNVAIIPDKLVEKNRKENFSLHLALADGRDDECIHLSRVNASVEITDTDSESVLFTLYVHSHTEV